MSEFSHRPARPRITGPLPPLPLRHRRILLGLRQIDIAAAVGISPVQLSNLELGRTEAGPELRAALAAALGCRPEDLFPSSSEPSRGGD